MLKKKQQPQPEMSIQHAHVPGVIKQGITVSCKGLEGVVTSVDRKGECVAWMWTRDAGLVWVPSNVYSSDGLTSGQLRLGDWLLVDVESDKGKKFWSRGCWFRAICIERMQAAPLRSSLPVYAGVERLLLENVPAMVSRWRECFTRLPLGVVPF